ncbi:succinate dehydrogenase assembly factor 4 [Luteimonas sp. MJ250]
MTSPGDASASPPAREYGGRDGPDPTRYGDWEKNGRCIDF